MTDFLIMDENNLVDEIMQDAVIHVDNLKDRGFYKFMSVRFIRNGTEQAVQTVAVPDLKFSRDNHLEMLRQKLKKFIEDRPMADIRRDDARR